MKQVIYGMVCGIMILLFSVMLVVLQSRSVRQEELKLSLTEAMEAAMKQMENGQFSTDRELADAFAECFRSQINSDSSFRIHVACADVNKGILSVEVEQSYPYINGNTGNISCSRTMILEDRKQELVTPELCTVTFYLDHQDMEQQGNSYKQYQVAQGDVIPCPLSPSADYGKGQFQEWRDAGGYLADFSQQVTGDLVYYAVYE